jgi:O-antigen/teichoic acid export membrane protein
MNPPQDHLTGHALVARNTAWNLIGEVGPVAAALIAVPILIRVLDTERFGIFVIATAITGYLGVFDIGLGRAVTKLAADRIAVGKRAETARLLVTASALMLIFGIASGCVLAALARWAVYDALKVPPELRAETLSAFYLLAAAVPIITMAAGFRGTLAAFQRFDLINAVRIPVGILLFMGPLAVLPFSHRLPYLVAALLAVRAAAWLAQLLLCQFLLPELRVARPDAAMVKPLLSFGGWITVSNLVGPLLIYADRLVIGAIISMEAVAWYTTPYEIAGRLWVIPGAVASAMFPAFSHGFARDDGRPILLLRRGLTFIFLTMFSCVLVIVTFAREGLTLWLGPAFAMHSYRVLQWLAVGVFLNGIAWAPYTLIQAAHRPDLTAKVHLIEAVCYLVLLWWMTRSYGIEGAAVARTISASADGVAFLLIAMAIFPASKRVVRNTLLAMTGASGLAAVGSLLTADTAMKVVFLAAVSFGWVLGGWRFLAPDRIRRNFDRFLGRGAAATPNL